jgi:hypothetical protein
MIGAHLMRRKGQSLEFREFAPYTLGDDIRHVDWRASARYGAGEDWLVRNFAAEEQLTIVISIDTRDTMGLPEAAPKVQIAFWLAEAIALIALCSNDQVILHRLFGRPAGSVVELRSSGDVHPTRSALHSALRRFSVYDGPTHPANLKVLSPYLPPAAVWVILTDLYFPWDKQAHLLARRIAAAQDGLRWVILVDLDSWPHEMVILGEGVRLIEGPRSKLTDTPVDITSDSIREVETKIDLHKRRFKKLIHHAVCDVISWKWPSSEKPEPESFFRNAFLGDKVLQRLFMRETR